MMRGRFHFYVIAGLCLLLSLLVIGCSEASFIVYRPTRESVSGISFLEAKKTINQLWQENASLEPYYKQNSKSGVKFKKESIKLNLTDATGHSYGFYPELSLSKCDPLVMEYYGSAHPLVRMNGVGGWGTYFHNRSTAIAFANALYAYKNTAPEAYAAAESAEAAFLEAAKKYRDMPVRPPLPEDVQRLRVLAEDAFQNKDFKKAAKYYEQALEIEPLWPDGQYNAAFLYGEIKDYEMAVNHMKRYLAIVPEAKDAKEARETMYLWEGKAKEAGKE